MRVRERKEIEILNAIQIKEKDAATCWKTQLVAFVVISLLCYYIPFLLAGNLTLASLYSLESIQSGWIASGLVVGVSWLFYQCFSRGDKDHKIRSIPELRKKALEADPEAKAVPAHIRPIGIKNESDTCFLAALVQMILTDERLTKALLLEDRSKGPTKEVGQFLNNYLKAKASGRTNSISGIKELRTALSNISKKEALSNISEKEDWSAGQHDAAEAFRIITQESNLLARLKKRQKFPEKVVRHYFSMPKGRRLLLENDMKFDAERNLHYSEQREPFYGSVFVKISPDPKQPCEFRTLDPELNQNVEGYQRDTVDENGENYRPETIPYQDSVEKWTLPPTQLIVQFNRFQHHPTPHRLSTAVQLSEQITVPASMLENEQERHYVLKALIVQTGCLSCGHYRAYVQEAGKWYHLNDARCKEVQAQEDKDGNEVSAFSQILEEEKENIYLARYVRIDCT